LATASSTVAALVVLMAAPPRLRGWRRERTRHTPVARHVSLRAQDLLYREEVSGLVLILSAAAAVALASSPWSGALERIWSAHLTIDLGLLRIEESLRRWIDDLLMAMFFLSIALEIKEEVLHGRLARWKDAALPVVMAAGGMVVPALVFLAVTSGTPAARGWAIPMATDVAFALGVIALLGRRVPDAARLLLLAVAVVDDIGSILVIAVFYTHDFRIASLTVAIVPLGALLLLRVLRVRSLSAYLLAGAVLWFTVFRSGIHPTLAGVILAAFIPARRLLAFDEYANRIEDGAKRLRSATKTDDAQAIIGELDELSDETQTPLERLRSHLHPWVSYCVLPLFALANAGVSLTSIDTGALREPVALGIIAGLVLGKPAGMLAAGWLAIRLGMAQLPSALSRHHFAGLGILSGIGFTVSLFIAALSYRGPMLATARAAILLSSVAMAVVGFAWFRIRTRRRASVVNATEPRG
jgi:NhaA family Na+:H+ antiporter